MITKTDYALAALVGFLTGIFAIPVVLNLGLPNKTILLLLPVVVPILFALGVWLGGLLARFVPIVTQLSKFVTVGFSNTAIDFGILNLLSMATGFTEGFIIGGVNVPGFLAASLNSYFWNKFWVFRKVDEQGIFHDFPKFFGITLVGVFINGAIVVFLTTYVSPLFGLNPAVWLNLSKALATVFTMVWNFVGYKLVVFRK